MDLSRKGHHNSDYKKEALTAAKDFRYGTNVIKKINDAETDDEILRIMHSAREEKFGK